MGGSNAIRRGSNVIRQVANLTLPGMIAEGAKRKKKQAQRNSKNKR